MSLPRTVSEKDGDFQWKIAKYHTLVFCVPTEGIGYWRRESKTRMMGLPGRQRSLTISSAVWIQCTNVTDGQTPVDIKDRAYALRPAVK